MRKVRCFSVTSSLLRKFKTSSCDEINSNMCSSIVSIPRRQIVVAMPDRSRVAPYRCMTNPVRWLNSTDERRTPLAISTDEYSADEYDSCWEWVLSVSSTLTPVGYSDIRSDSPRDPVVRRWERDARMSRHHRSVWSNMTVMRVELIFSTTSQIYSRRSWMRRRDRMNAALNASNWVTQKEFVEMSLMLIETRRSLSTERTLPDSSPDPWRRSLRSSWSDWLETRVCEVSTRWMHFDGRRWCDCPTERVHRRWCCLKKDIDLFQFDCSANLLLLKRGITASCFRAQ